MRVVVVYIVLALLSFSCKEKEKEKEEWNEEAFYEQVMQLIEERSIKRNEIDWVSLKQTVKDSIKQFSTNEDVYNAIGYALELVDDGHSHFFAPENPDSVVTNRFLMDTLTVPAIDAKIIGEDIGYIKLPGFFANDSLSSVYALKVRKALLKLDASGKFKGWVIDLRKNLGGKMSSESLGLSPLFNRSLIGISCDNQERFTKVCCSDGDFYFGDFKMDSLIYKSTLQNKNKKIAVLISNHTASASEFLALAFKFQEGTKTFGSKTRGATSTLNLLEFKSNAKLLLAQEYYCDKDYLKITSGILPDVACDTAESLPKAIEWIRYDR
ncbi:S41 family peptidase [Zobellia galactanivorans]|uniref:S41 family peptidase n=1 Tax=Zobellia galactanivorans (strain DSM 12802 / CCUG 47099 / CIP 106680 / NCIMB 13871 / Dsij) TaxID=63186 RepID=UPI001C07EE7F|nr:S41 family peptidase [Zobellia galactanivorans]MBU3026764.1 S41 family peptidase [Zobellia galactanivorans]